MNLKMLFQSENKRQNAAVCLMALVLSVFLDVTVTSCVQHWGFVTGIVAFTMALGLPAQEPQ